MHEGSTGEALVCLVRTSGRASAWLGTTAAAQHERARHDAEQAWHGEEGEGAQNEHRHRQSSGGLVCAAHLSSENPLRRRDLDGRARLRGARQEGRAEVGLHGRRREGKMRAVL